MKMNIFDRFDSLTENSTEEQREKFLKSLNKKQQAQIHEYMLWTTIRKLCQISLKEG